MDAGVGSPSNFATSGNVTSSPMKKVKEITKSALRKVKYETTGSIMGHAPGNQTNGY
jgi:hypothetical protein